MKKKFNEYLEILKIQYNKEDHLNKTFPNYQLKLPEQIFQVKNEN